MKVSLKTQLEDWIFFVPSTRHQNCLDKSLELYNINKLSVISSLIIIDNMTKNLLFFLRVYILVLNTKRKIRHAKSRKKNSTWQRCKFWNLSWNNSYYIFQLFEKHWDPCIFFEVTEVDYTLEYCNIELSR